MALIPVRPKDSPDAPIQRVDETWLTRWPDDFDRVPDDEIAKLEAAEAAANLEALGAHPYDPGELIPATPDAAPQEAPSTPGTSDPDDEPRTEQSSRSRF